MIAYLDLDCGKPTPGAKLQGWRWGTDNTAATNINRLFWITYKGSNCFT